MKEQIEQALRVLIGLPLWAAGRAASLEWFQFGARRTVTDMRGSTKEVGDYALHVDCAWRITGPEGIVVGSADRFYAAGDDPYHKLDKVDWESLSGKNRSDERIAAFFSGLDSPLVVEDVWADNVGSVRLALSGGYKLEVFPHTSLEGENWRLFRSYTDEPHFVVTGFWAGLDEEYEDT